MKCWVASIVALLERLAGAHLAAGGLDSSSSVVVVLVLLIERQEAVEFDHRAGGAQVEHAAADLGGDVDGGAFELGRLHLARDRAQPDQLVEPGLVGIETARDLARAGAPRSVGRIASCASCAFFALV